MTLTFPNRSRSYDPAGQRIRFVGHDGMFEIPFFLENNALPAKARGTATDEKNCLAAFDEARSTIYDVAQELYSHGRKNMFVLTRRDFR